VEPDRLLYDKNLRDKAILALQRAIVATFEKGDWQELGYEIGHHDYIASHDRLLRSLKWNDPDCGGCVFEFLTYLSRRDLPALYRVAAHPKVKEHLQANASEVLTELGLADKQVATPNPPSPSAKEVVRRALVDSEHLLNSSGATCEIESLHTALHGYLRSVCQDAGIDVGENASVTSLFRQLRSNHPAFKNLGPQEAEISRILLAFSTVVDALNTIRNHASVAHPNEQLLAEAEATLAVNAIRTLFNYLVTRLA
jgi:hypothetical protein